MATKTIYESCDKRLYATPQGGAVSCCIQHQNGDDHDDGQEDGWYGWCGFVEDQSDYVLGPYESKQDVFDAYEKKNKSHIRCSRLTLHSGGTGRAPTFVEHPSETRKAPIQSFSEARAAQERWKSTWAKIDENNRRYAEDRSRR